MQYRVEDLCVSVGLSQLNLGLDKIRLEVSDLQAHWLEKSGTGWFCISTKKPSIFSIENMESRNW